MSDSDDSSEFGEEAQERLVRDFEAEGKLLTCNLLPRKSLERYNAVYDKFRAWQVSNNTSSLDESVILVYFDEMCKTIKPSTAWARWSMLRTTLSLRHNVDIENYKQLKSFLKNMAIGYQPKQAKSLTGEEIKKFIDEADDFHYLAAKVVLIFGVCGTTRCCELVNLNESDVQDFDDYYSVSIKDSKNDYPRTFMICAPFYELVKKYIQLRPDDLASNRFFVHYSKGKCTRQVIVKHKISEIPRVVASYLNLKDVELYTGHALRRTSASLLSDSGASLQRVKNLGAWKSDAVAQRYIDHSKMAKKTNFEGIVGEIGIPEGPSTSKDINTVPVPNPLIDTITITLSDVNSNNDEDNSNSVRSPLESQKHKLNNSVNNNVIYSPQKIKRFKISNDENEENQVYECQKSPKIINCQNITINYYNNH